MSKSLFFLLILLHLFFLLPELSILIRIKQFQTEDFLVYYLRAFSNTHASTILH